MLARQLDYAPTADELPFTVQVMTEDLLQHGLRDADGARVQEAFRKLGPTIQRWPTARAVIEALPVRQQPRQALPKPSSPDKAHAALGRIKLEFHGRRSVFLPGESYADYLAAAASSGKSKSAFDAERLSAHGWSADQERQYQRHGELCSMRLRDDELIAELSRLEATDDPEARAEREAIQSEANP